MEKISKELTLVYPQYAANAPLPNSVATLVLAILSVALCGIGLVLGIIAIVLGYKDKATYKSSHESYSTASLANAKAGITCGIVRDFAQYSLRAFLCIHACLSVYAFLFS